MDYEDVVEGIDISHYQAAIQFHDVVAAGKQFVYAKATQGRGEVDFCFSDFRTRAGSVSLLFGAYHFFEPGVDAIAQARHFVDVASPKSGDLITMLDTETAGANVAAESLAFALEVKQLTGKLPFVYTSDSMYGSLFAETFPGSAGWGLWLARYGHSLAHDANIWQYSDCGAIGAVNCDLDRFYGSIEDLKGEYCYP